MWFKNIKGNLRRFPFFVYLYYMTPNQEKLIKQYNQNPDLIEKVYNKDRGEMLQYFINLNLLDYLDEELFDDYLDLVLYEKLDGKKGEDRYNTAKNIAEKYLSGELVFENGKIYYDADKEDLLQIFDDSRDGVRYVADKILSSHDDWWEPYQDVTNKSSFYNDCIETLTNKNKMLLSNRIIKELLGTQISPDTELLEEIAEEQGHPEYVELSTGLIYNRLLDDEETTKHLLFDESDIGDELMWRYNDAYNQAAVDYYYKKVIDSIKGFFETDTPPEHNTYKYKSQYTNKEVEKEILRVDVTQSAIPTLVTYLSNWKDANRHNEDIAYFGSYTALIKQLLDWGELSHTRFNVDDYVDYRDVEKIYNEIIVEDVI